MDNSQNTAGDIRDPQNLAELLLRKHKVRALKIAANRAMRLGVAGDRAGALEWLEISVCVRELITRRDNAQNSGPAKPEPGHPTPQT